MVLDESSILPSVALAAVLIITDAEALGVGHGLETGEDHDVVIIINGPECVGGRKELHDRHTHL